MTAAVPVRFCVAACIGLALATLVFGATASGSARAWSADLAPASSCKGSTQRVASPRLQRHAITCLVNWARAQSRQGRLSPSHSLQRAAALKGHGVASCRQISHTPCGSDAAAPIRRSGYAYSRFGENLYVGALGSVSAREVVSAWLQSPGHRANIFNPAFRDVGAALVRADGIFNEGAAVVWITAFASPR